MATYTQRKNAQNDNLITREDDRSMLWTVLALIIAAVLAYGTYAALHIANLDLQTDEAIDSSMTDNAAGNQNTTPQR